MGDTTITTIGNYDRVIVESKGNNLTFYVPRVNGKSNIEAIAELTDIADED